MKRAVKKKINQMMLAIAVILMGMASMVGCQTRENHDMVTISILNSKPEMRGSLEEAIKSFSKQYPQIEIKLLPYPVYQELTDQIASRKSQGNLPTIMIVDSSIIRELKDGLLDLSGEKWCENITMDMGETATNSEGKLIAFPFAIEGMGLIYNKEIMEKCGVDVTAIHTQEALEEAFKKVEASGKKAVIITNEDWSLAQHFFSTAYSLEMASNGNAANFVEQLKKGTADLSHNAFLNGILDTFDQMKAHNMYKNEPLKYANERSAEAMGKGEVGFWYMGNWAYQDIIRNDANKKEYGMIPVPISQNASDFGNNELAAVVKYLVVDKSTNSPEQQDAAKKFINWLVYDQEGRDFVVKDAELIPGVVAQPEAYTNGLSNAISDYQKKNQIFEQITAYYPEDYSSRVGELLRMYLADQITREAFFKELEAYWKQVE